MNAVAVFGTPHRPGALSQLREFQLGLVHTEPNEREPVGKELPANPLDVPPLPGQTMEWGWRFRWEKDDKADADKDSGRGLVFSSTGALVSVPWGKRCRGMSLPCQTLCCLAWNWCLRFLVAALVHWLWGPLERFLVAHRWGIAGWAVMALSLHLVWQDPFFLFIWIGVSVFVLWYWAMWHWPVRRMAA